MFRVRLFWYIARGRLPPGNSFFLLPTKERTKENCRCFDAADPRPRGCTPLGTPKRKSEDSAAKRTQYYCPFLTPPNLPPLLSRVFPRTPAAVNFLSLCRGRACPARNLPSYLFYGQSVGEGFIPPGHFPAAANGHGGQRAGRPTGDTGKAAPLRGVGDAAPYISIAVNLPAAL